MGVAIGSNVGSLQAQSGIFASHKGAQSAGDLVDIARIADLALSNTTEILSRIRELNIQAGSGTLDTTARGDVQNEIAVLQAELDRLAHASELNGTPLVSARAVRTYQVGSGNRTALAEWLGRESSVDLASARGRLIDADVATESSHLSRGIILSHATASVPVQANQHPQAALRLLA